MVNASFGKVTQAAHCSKDRCVGSPGAVWDGVGTIRCSMGSFTIYFLFLIPPMIIGFVIQHRLKKTVATADAGRRRERHDG